MNNITCHRLIQYLKILTSIHKRVHINLPVATLLPDKFTGVTVLVAVILMVPSGKDTISLTGTARSSMHTLPYR